MANMLKRVVFVQVAVMARTPLTPSWNSSVLVSELSSADIRSAATVWEVAASLAASEVYASSAW